MKSTIVWTVIILLSLSIFGCMSHPLSNRGDGLDLNPYKQNRKLTNSSTDLYLVAHPPRKNQIDTDSQRISTITTRPGAQINVTVGALNHQGKTLNLSLIDPDSQNPITSFFNQHLPLDQPFWGKTMTITLPTGSYRRAVLRLSIPDEIREIQLDCPPDKS